MKKSLFALALMAGALLAQDANGIDVTLSSALAADSAEVGGFDEPYPVGDDQEVGLADTMTEGAVSEGVV